MSRFAKCSVCGRITNDFVTYGSLFLRDEYPAECPHICSSSCMTDASDKIESGEWFVPRLKKTMGGYAHDISMPRQGYDQQPTQEEMVRALLENQKENS